jgi:hypothetical protein
MPPIPDGASTLKAAMSTRLWAPALTFKVNSAIAFAADFRLPKKSANEELR